MIRLHRTKLCLLPVLAVILLMGSAGTPCFAQASKSTECATVNTWWSVQPLHDAEPPQTSGGGTDRWARNAIDNFILASLAEHHLKPSPEADRRTLIRRVYFDLIGLPPTPQEVDAFVNDTSGVASGDTSGDTSGGASGGAYERLVDRLLASPHYGERWARHWLDVIRFGESQGFERDKLRPDAWRYRDWVIDALNRDMPYDQFARQQIAGDVLAPNVTDAIIATGFLVAGPWDEVGQTQQSEAMRAVVRQDELEDIVGTVGQTFLGMTVHCARCHDHKFDPITQREYYQMASALSGVRHGERAINLPAAQQRRALEERRAQLQRQVAAVEQAAIQQIQSERKDGQQKALAPPQPIALWDFSRGLRDQVGGLHLTAHGGAKLADGRLVLDGKSAYASSAPAALQADLKTKTLEVVVQLADLEQRGGAAISVQTPDGGVFDAIVFGEREPRRWMAGSDFFRRTDSFQGPDEADANGRPACFTIVYQNDGTIAGYRDGRPYGRAYKSNGPAAFAAGKAQVLLGLRHGTGATGGRMLAGGIVRAKLFDRALSPAEVAASAGAADYVAPQEITARLTPTQREQRERASAEIIRLGKQIDALRDAKTYAVVPREPEVTHVLLRGDPSQQGDAVAAGGIASISGLSPDFGLGPGAPEAQRRIRLAQWITSDRNSLFARVIVNRLWHDHFGEGIVDTPNDLGVNGGRPSHPMLLDYLANDLIAHGWSLKHLHRLIVASATYRQASRYRDDAAQVDRDNRLLWRRRPRRLDAESLRDAILAVGGQLNPAVGGPPFQDFRTFVRNTQFYEMLDPVGFEFNRRTIYRTWARSGRNPLLDVFDCPDPSTTTPRRAVTTTPIQSLALLNNSFVLRMADDFAARVTRDPRSAGASVPDQIAGVYRLAYGRAPRPAEVAAIEPFVKANGLPAFCRVVFNSNEFLYVE